MPPAAWAGSSASAGGPASASCPYPFPLDRECIRAGICDAAVVDVREWRQGMQPGLAHAGDVPDLMPANYERVGDQRAVTLPGHGFGAHDGHTARGRQTFQLHERLREIAVLHVIGITAERNRSEERRVGKECRSRWSP